MSKTILNFILLFLLLIPAQAVIFNNLILFNVAIPLVFIYLIIRLPMTVSVNAALTIGFITGLSVDIFSDTVGVNAMACTLLAFVLAPGLPSLCVARRPARRTVPVDIGNGFGGIYEISDYDDGVLLPDGVHDRGFSVFQHQDAGTENNLQHDFHFYRYLCHRQPLDKTTS